MSFSRRDLFKRVGAVAAAGFVGYATQAGVFNLLKRDLVHANRRMKQLRNEIRYTDGAA